MFAFVRGHRQDDGFHALEGVIVDIHILDGFAHAWNHRHQVLDITHLLDLGYLGEEVVEVELVFGQFLLQFRSFLLVVLHLGFLHERADITHAQDTLGQTVWMEDIESFHLLTLSDELDRLVHHGLDGQGGTTAGVTVHLGQNHAVEVQFVVKGFGSIDGILARHGVHHEENFVRVDGIFDVANLVHHLLIHGQTTSGIDDDHIVAVFLGVFDRIFGDFNRLFAAFLGINRNLNLLAQNLQLVDSGGTIHVASHQQRFLVAFLLEHVGQLGGVGGLT